MPVHIIQPSDTDPAGFGRVPSLNGVTATAVPDPITGSSPTQEQQGTNATTQAAAQAIFLPPAPTMSEVVPGARMTGPWVVWFQKLNQKLGGYNTQFLSTVTASAPFTGTGTASDPIVIHVADSTHDGYLSQTDWATFNAKQPALGFTPANRAGDTFTGAVTFSAAVTFSSTAAFQGVGFFNTAPVTVKPSAPTAATALTSAFGTGGTALADVGAAYSQATLNNNFKSVVDKTTNLENRIAAVYAAIQSLGLQA